MKKYCRIAILVLSFFIISACSSSVKNEIHSLAEGKTDFYSSEEELYNAASVVMIAQRESNETNVVKNIGASSAYYGYTLSDVKVVEIIKNASGSAIEAGDTIPVYESQFTYEDQKELITYHINSYTMMIPDHQYILYLNYSEHDGWYYILTGVQGKIPLLDEEQFIFPQNELTAMPGQQIGETSSLFLKTQKEIIAKSREKYGK